MERCIGQREHRRWDQQIQRQHGGNVQSEYDLQPVRIGDRLIELLEAETEYTIGRNQPYSVNIEADYTVPIHCEARGIPYVEIELRQDMIGDDKSQREWAKLLAGIFPRAVDKSDVLAA